MRLFVSINPNAATKDKLSGVINSLKCSLNSSSLKVLRWEAVEKIHLTLFFIGESPGESLQGIKSSVEKAVKKFEGGIITLNANSVGVFPNLKRPRVIFFSLGGEVSKLVELQNTISKNLSAIGYRQDKKFNQHLTFARVKFPSFQLSDDLQKLTSALKFNINFVVNKVSLMKSTLKADGAVHEELAGWEIKKATISDRLKVI